MNTARCLVKIIETAFLNTSIIQLEITIEGLRNEAFMFRTNPYDLSS